MYFLNSVTWWPRAKFGRAPPRRARSFSFSDAPIHQVRVGYERSAAAGKGMVPKCLEVAAANFRDLGPCIS